MHIAATGQPSFHRRRFLRQATVGTLATTIAGQLACAQETTKVEKSDQPSLFRAVELNHLALDTPKRDQAIAFYESNFGMTNISHGRTVRDTFLHFSKGFMNLGEAESAGMNHFCLGIEDFNRDSVYRMLNMLDLKPFVIGGGNLHVLDPDGLNVQIQELGHGYGNISPSDLTQAKEGLLETVLIHHLSLTVTDVARSRDFYGEMFGLRPVGANEADHCVLGLGHGFLELHKGLKASMNHFGLAVKTFDIAKITDKLKKAGVEEVTSTESLVSLHDSSGLIVQVTP